MRLLNISLYLNCVATLLYETQMYEKHQYTTNVFVNEQNTLDQDRGE